MFNESELQKVDITVQVMYKWIRENIKEGSTILELGSGATTEELGKYYKMFSIENNKKWCYKYNNTFYILAPIKKYSDKNPAPKGFPHPNNGWYDVSRLMLPEKYDLIIIDGPKGSSKSDYGRAGFYKHLDLFNTNVPMIFHDVGRPVEKHMVLQIAVELEKRLIFLDRIVGSRKTAIIL